MVRILHLRWLSDFFRGCSTEAGSGHKYAMSVDFQPNNFDLLRLLAALQVVVGHVAFGELGQYTTPLGIFLRFIPGVPVFFFISGFLISASWERLDNARDYVVNRSLRIFPAYWGAFCVSLLAILFLYKNLDLHRNFGNLALWAVAQLVMLPQWNPEFLHGYGVGVVNGALWTIPVELSFYAAIPVIYYLFRRMRASNAVLLAVIVASFSLQYADYAFDAPKYDKLWELLGLTPFPWIGIFAMGILAYRKRALLLPLVCERVWLFGLLYLALCLVTVMLPLSPLLAPATRYLGTANTVGLCALVLSAAYSQRNIAAKLLRRNDISYGVYLFHLPCLNIMLSLNVPKQEIVWLLIPLTMTIATVSWFFVEKPALALRKHALYRHNNRT